jgi:hypothetical protein
MELAGAFREQLAASGNDGVVVAAQLDDPRGFEAGGGVGREGLGPSGVPAVGARGGRWKASQPQKAQRTQKGGSPGVGPKY